MPLSIVADSCQDVETCQSELTRHFALAVLIRAVEERLLELFSQGKLHGTVHTCIGQEFTGVAISEFLRPDDFVFSNHRCHGHYIARTNDVDGLIAELMGRVTGVCGGRGGSQHLCRDGFFSNGIQGGIMPVAAGLAFAQQFRGKQGISVVFIGDGTLGEGAVYETLNIAAKWHLPLLVVVENNLYSQSTRQVQTLAGEIRDRASAFGIETAQADTWDPAQLVQTAKRCIATVRDAGRPMLLQVDTYRLNAHSKGDDDRSPAEVAEYRERDPLHRYARDNANLATVMLAEAQDRLDLAVEAAEREPAETLDHLLSTGTSMPRRPVEWQTVVHPVAERSVVQIRKALERALERDPRVVLVGEDIESPYGGAFKATQGLSARFPDRVRNTPIAESLIVGLGNGLALAGMLPVCEIMFGDFLALAADQLINHAAKFRSMYNEQVRVPLIVRTPMGGRRGYGPTHSQSLEKHFLGIPDLLVLATNHRFDPGLLYDRLFESIAGPTLVIENKVLYGQRVSSEMPTGFVLEQSDELFPSIRWRPEGPPDVTVVCYGEMLREVEAAVVRAFDEFEIIAEVLCVAQLSPLNVVPIVDAVRHSGRLLVIEEGVGFAGFGAEVVAQVAEHSGQMPLVRRLASQPFPIPANAALERELLPHTESIVSALRELMSRTPSSEERGCSR